MILSSKVHSFQFAMHLDNGRKLIPQFRKHPATAIIFVGSLLTLVFGVLNLIVAVASRPRDRVDGFGWCWRMVNTWFITISPDIDPATLVEDYSPWEHIYFYMLIWS